MQVSKCNKLLYNERKRTGTIYSLNSIVKKTKFELLKVSLIKISIFKNELKKYN